MKSQFSFLVREFNKDITVGPGKPFHENETDKLPEPVKKYLDFTGFSKIGHVNCLRLRQEGIFRSSLQAGWMPFTAEQYFNPGQVSFAWYARMSGPLGIKFHAVDRYVKGEGRMHVKLANMYTIADSKGPEIDQGELIRYLAEMMWFPSSFTDEYIHWESIDDLSAKATITHNNISASGIFHFEKDGRLNSFTARRYKAGGKYYFLEDWITPVLNYSQFGDVLIPSDTEVTWKLNIGELTYAKLRLKSIEFNNPGIY